MSFHIRKAQGDISHIGEATGSQGKGFHEKQRGDRSRQDQAFLLQNPKRNVSGVGSGGSDEAQENRWNFLWKLKGN